jgi:DNA-nicking Smr family endonuclease
MSDEDAPFAFDPDAESEYPIDGELDLHTFAPRDVPFVVQDYLDECQRRGILAIRIVHGKGQGTLRRTVEAALKKRSDVIEAHLAPRERGGWGATLVTLRADPVLAAEGPTKHTKD